MGLIAWSDNLSVGVEQLDKDHQVLIGIINELYDAMVEGHGEELLESIFSRLKEYTMTHFFREESLMSQYGYPEYAEHKQQHEELISQLDDFKQRYTDSRNEVNTIKVSQFLQDWLIVHVMKEDFKYKSFFKECGLV